MNQRLLLNLKTCLNCFEFQTQIRSLRIFPVIAAKKKETSEPHNVADTSVPGLSSKVVTISTGEVGPGASRGGQYKNVEYFCYHKMSYFDAELEMLQYRLPQPSAV